ncbi:thiol-disulfide oxidoreductase DCC family protein [Flavobacterium hauense]
MKILTNQTLLYDEDCPLCRAYTSGFIATGMLDENGRKPYACLSDEELTYVDANRACNEIALVDNENKTVTYGIDSLLKVLGNSFPFIEKIGYFKPVNCFLKKLYSFISYNRKVIIPNRADSDKQQCIPDFNYRYRIAYLVFAVLVTATVLFECAKIIPIYVQANFLKELALATGQIAFQSLFILKKDSKTRLTYLGNLMTVSLFGSLLLMPLLILNHYVAISETVNLIWFGIVVFIMFLEHYRRIQLLGLPKHLCLTWIAYRMLALPFYYI